MAEIKVLHVVPRWNYGGGAQSILAEAEYRGDAAERWEIRHEVLSLEKGGALPLLKKALRLRVRVHFAPAAEEEEERIRSADVVVFHYWNAPSTRAFVDRWRGRELRWILYCRVNGLHGPQRLAPALCENACRTILTSPSSLRLVGSVDSSAEVIPALVPDVGWQAAAEGRPHRSWVHVGTLNVFKLRPDWVDRHVGLVSGESDDRIGVVGAGGQEGCFQAAAAHLGAEDQFQWHGFVNDLPSLLANYRAFTAPMSSMTYASSDKAIQECQLAGLPVVVPSDSPVAHLVEDGVTGFHAADATAYRDRLEQLVRGENLPRREAVRAQALHQHGCDAKATRLRELYREVAAGSPRGVDDGLPAITDWVAFQCGEDFRSLKQSSARTVRLKELALDSGAIQRFQAWGCEGGLAQFLNADPELAALAEIR